MDARLVDFIANFDKDMMDATVAYCIVLYCSTVNPLYLAFPYI